MEKPEKALKNTKTIMWNIFKVNKDKNDANDGFLVSLLLT